SAVRRPDAQYSSSVPGGWSRARREGTEPGARDVRARRAGHRGAIHPSDPSRKGAPAHRHHGQLRRRRDAPAAADGNDVRALAPDEAPGALCHSSCGRRSSPPIQRGPGERRAGRRADVIGRDARAPPPRLGRAAAHGAARRGQ
ncbi:hypothetical protein PVAP13_8KG353302, partial [Panicum virgatum]